MADEPLVLMAGPGPALPSERLPAALRAQRLAREAVMDLAPGLAGSPLERWRRRLRLAPQEAVLGVLRLLGAYRGGAADFADMRVRENELALPGLPAALAGRRLLQVSDLHTDLNPAVVDAVAGMISGCGRIDATVLTGDYRCRATGDTAVALAGMTRLLAVLPQPVIAILGNHDTLAVADSLAAAGVCVLVNEGVRLGVASGAAVTVAGIDDAHYFETDDLAAVSGFGDGPGILLTHTPAVALRSLAKRFDYLLCGHTHGGQICFPGGKPIRVHRGVPAATVKGRWRVGGVSGYTCPGAGGSGISWRLNCPPAISVHELVDAASREVG